MARLWVTAVYVRFVLDAERLIWPLGDGRILDLLWGGMRFSFLHEYEIMTPWTGRKCSLCKMIYFSVGMGGGRSVAVALGRAREGPSGFSHFLVFPVHPLDQQHAFWPCSPECC